ncbi:MAG: neutral/alkaline non-lysosomal ceramidase N-terminal domain-containing protein [Flavobacteriales bacterium]|nr:neutral/alkaline non-lysosomal ceramidase N-terminal domain-containing protein [Flavobacteriales bacterium]MCX7649205.1 neutral/alkaline non-lysosomal ceramidase N-terminal domain-containing protein [Flavobacteriales bacterium]MDW8431437.1 neutral/alkaline non-lysosomal ceramidase N-terminal domain-containing protein [Flavobacteriales bacterium]
MKAGAGKSEIQVKGYGYGMMGYGREFNVVRGQHAPLWVRSVYLEDSESQSVVISVAEICFVLQELKTAVLERLNSVFPSAGLNDDNFLFSAQHTHSGPGGYSHFPFYNWSIPGYKPDVFEAIVEATVRSVSEALLSAQPARLYWGSAEFAPHEDVAFQRSLKAYLRNPGVERFSDYETHLALERTMYLLKVENMEGRLLATINWFGVHTTSLGNKVGLLSPDNKGYAAALLEQRYPEHVALFAQQFAGDVSPNFHGKGKSWVQGRRYKDQVESALFNGRLQYEKARYIMDKACRPVEGPISVRSYLVRRDFHHIPVPPEYAEGQAQARTVPACLGAAFLRGTPVDGKGMPHGLYELTVALARSVKATELMLARVKSPEYRQRIETKYAMQDPKDIVFETGEGFLLGSRDLKNFVMPGITDAGIWQFKQEHRRGALRTLPWTPHVLPLQLITIGPIAIAAFPGEITTEAGRQLRHLILNRVRPAGIHNIVIQTYSNHYFGYCTTVAEYMEQAYEGGHCVFGKYTHGAFMKEFEQLATALVSGKVLDPGPPYETFPEEEIKLRTYDSEKNPPLRSYKNLDKKYRPGYSASENSNPQKPRKQPA